MADFLSEIEQLKRLAAKARPAPPLAAEPVMRRLRELEAAPPELDCPESVQDDLPIRLFLWLGGAAAAAAAAIVPLGVQAWNELSDPHRLLSAMPGLPALIGV